MVEAARQTLFIFLYVAAGMLVFGWLMYACWIITGERQAIACRKAYLAALLKQ